MCKRLALILGLWLMAGVAAGAERGVALRAVPEAELERLGFDAGESSALFVGVSQFSKDETLAPVPYAVDDAVDLAHLFVLELGLVSPGRVTLALSGEPAKAESVEGLAALKAAGARIEPADRSDIRRLLGRQSQLAGAQGLFLVGFATHGFTDRGEDYLLARDSLLGYPGDTAVPKRWLLDALAEAKTQRRFALLDACRERFRQGERGGGAAAMSPSFHEALARAQGTVVLAATTTGGFAFDDPERQNGVFSAAILDGLHGGAPKTEEHHVTAGTLADYVDQQVRAWVSEKRPLSVSSPGITRTIEGAGAELPLAHDPTAEDQARLREYVDRRAAALERLRGNLGGPLSGALYDRIFAYLDTESPGDEQRELLEQIEELDGSERSKKALAAYVLRYLVDRPGQVSVPPASAAAAPAPVPDEPGRQESAVAQAPAQPDISPQADESAATGGQAGGAADAANDSTPAEAVGDRAIGSASPPPEAASPLPALWGWLDQHLWEIFSGIGTAAVVGLLGWLAARQRRRGKSPASQDASLQPVAEPRIEQVAIGSNNTQAAGADVSQKAVHQAGSRSVHIDGSASNNVIVTGDGNTVRTGTKGEA